MKTKTVGLSAMKSFIKAMLVSVAIISASCTPAHAGNIDCSGQSELATAIMKARQYGVSVSAALAIAEKEKNKDVSKLAKALVNLAYLKPRYAGAEYRANEATDFGTEIYNLCNQNNKR